MPRLPTEQDLGQTNRPVPRPPNRIASHKGATGLEGAGAQGLTNVGNELGKASSIFAKYQDEIDDTNAKDIYATQFYPAARAIFQEYKGKYGKDAVDNLPIYTEKLNELGRKLSNGLTPNQKSLVDGYTRSHILSRLDSMAAHATSEKKAWQIGVQESSLANIISNVSSDPDNPETIQNAITDSANLIINSPLSIGKGDLVISQEIKSAYSKIFANQIISQRVKDPILALKTLQRTAGQIDPVTRYKLFEQIFTDAAPLIAEQIARSPKIEITAANDEEAKSMASQLENMRKPFNILVGGEAKTVADGLTGDQKLKVLVLAEKIASQNISQYKAESRNIYQDLLASLRNGVSVPPEVEANIVGRLPIEFQKEASITIVLTKEETDASKKLNGMPESQWQNILNTDLPPIGSGTAIAERLRATRIKAAGIERTRRKNFPAEVAITESKVVSDSWRKAFDVLNGKEQDPNVARKIIDDYVQASTTEQRRLEIENPKILPNEIADLLAKKFTDAAGTQETVEVIEQLSGQFGKHWGLALKELGNKGINDSALVIGSGVTRDVGMIMSSLTNEKVSVLKQNILPTDVTEITDKLRKKFDSFYKSLTSLDIKSGIKTYDAFYNETHKLAIYYASKGSSNSEAAEKAANDTFNKKYEFVTSGPTYVRIPIKDEGVLRRITRGMKAAILDEKAVKELNISPFSSGFALDENQRVTASNAIIVEQGYWVTSPDESGVVLYLEGLNNPSAVLDRQGNPVYKSWDELGMPLTEFYKDRTIDVPVSKRVTQ